MKCLPLKIFLLTFFLMLGRPFGGLPIVYAPIISLLHV